jgi:5-methylcytosine-specific restriction endonuclease McrA
MNYKDKRWIKKRERILRRDNYQCREHKRYGKTAEATTVHHIKPADDYPILKYDSKNLYSCCNKCHNSFHDRVTNELTEKGKALVNRIYGKVGV